jgi:hypothetical protein
VANAINRRLDAPSSLRQASAQQQPPLYTKPDGRGGHLRVSISERARALRVGRCARGAFLIPSRGFRWLLLVIFPLGTIYRRGQPTTRLGLSDSFVTNNSKRPDGEPSRLCRDPGEREFPPCLDRRRIRQPVFAPDPCRRGHLHSQP